MQLTSSAATIASAPRQTGSASLEGTQAPPSPRTVHRLSCTRTSQAHFRRRSHYNPRPVIYLFVETVKMPSQFGAISSSSASNMLRTTNYCTQLFVPTTLSCRQDLPCGRRVVQTQAPLMICGSVADAQHITACLCPTIYFRVRQYTCRTANAFCLACWAYRPRPLLLSMTPRTVSKM